MTSTEVSDGLVLPYAAMTIAGKGGAVGVLLITFMAVTSTLSAQIIAVSSIISFDIYRTYIRPLATDRDVIRWSHYGVVGFGLFAAAFSTALHYGGVNLGWTLYMLGVLTCPGIFPTVFAILWRRQSKVAAIVSPLLGMATGIATWLGSAYALYGSITIASTGQAVPCTWGTFASAVSPVPYSIILTLLTKPQNYDWADFKRVKLAFEVAHTATETDVAALEAELEADSARTNAGLKRWGRIAAYWALATFFGHWVLWPLPMYASHYIFQKGFFSAWLVIAIIWLWIAMLVAGFYPLIDGRAQLIYIFKSLRGKTEKSQPVQTPSSEGSVTDGSLHKGQDALVEEKV